MAAMEKITVPTLRPRNPLVVAARFRKAGAHANRRALLEKARLKEEKNAERG